MEGKNLKVEDLIEGEYYHADKDKIVFIHDGNKKRDEIGYSYRIQCFNKSGYYSRKGTYGRNGVIESTLRLATNEEKEWLKYAIKINKYISYEDFLKEYKPTYEKGKWYKYKNWYIKFEKNDEGYFKSSEEIDNNRIYRKVNSTFGRVGDKEKVLLEDLKEIESYLPKGHPDIQQKPEKFVGRYFKALVENAEYSNIIKNNYYLIEQENDISFGFHVKKYPSFYELSKKYKQNYELMPVGWTPSDVVPEYVECLEEDATYNIKNRIYKVISWKENSVWVICNLRCGRYNPGDSLCNDDWFEDKHKWKISTKEAYDLQNSKQYPLVPEECYNTEIEVGDEVEITINKYNHSPYKVGESFIIREISEQNGEIYYRPIEGRCTGIISTSVKLVKKANKTTTLDKKVDVSSPKVTNKITVPIINTTSCDKQVHINVDIKKDGVIVPLLTTTKKSIKNIQINNLKTLTI